MTIEIDPKARAQLATDVATQLRRVLRGFRTYDADHEILVGQRADLHQRLTAFLEVEDPAVFEITARTLGHEGKTLIEGDEREAEISLPLFLDGVQRLIFHGGVPAEEVDRLVQLWWFAIDGREASEQSFITRFWEEEFQQVSLVAVETFVQGEESEGEAQDASERQQQHVKAVIDELSGERLAGGARGEAAKLRMLRVTREDLAVLQMDELEGIDSEVLARHDEAELGGLSGLSPEAAGLLSDEASAPPARPVLRALCALLEVMDPTDPVSMEQVQILAGRIFQGLAEERAFELLSSALTETMTFARSDPARIDARCRALVPMMAGLEQPEVVAPMLQALDEPEVQAAAVGALQRLTPRSAALLLPALANLRTDGARVALLEILGRMKPTAAQLEQAFAQAGGQDALLLLELAGSAGEDRVDALLKLALGHAEPALRRKGAQMLGGQGAEAAQALRPLVLDEDPGVRKLALDGMMRAKVGDLPRSIRLLLGRESVGEEERRRLTVALGQIGGLEASLVLQRELRSAEDPELKVACILALGRCGDSKAIPALEEAASGWLTPRPIKDAVEEALRRLRGSET